MLAGIGVSTASAAAAIWYWRKEKLYRELFEQGREPLLLVDLTTLRIEMSNQAFRDLLGYTTQDLADLTLASLVIEKSKLSVSTRKGETLVRFGPKDYSGEQFYRHKNGSEIQVEVNTQALFWQEKKLLYISIRDITLNKQIESQLRHNATHDELTGLPNRALFMLRLKKAFHLMKQDGVMIAILFLDLDRFKSINDSFGHGTGDHFLTQVVERLSKVLQPHQVLARFGGDEFVVLLEHVYSLRDVTGVAQKLIDSLEFPLEVRGQKMHVSVSIGIACRGGDLSNERSAEDNPEQMLRDADIAMYQAKARGRSRYVIFDQEMYAQIHQKLILEAELRQAVEFNEFEVYYQPIIQLDTGHIIGFEALIRWNHPKHGLLFPSKFIAVAEETGLIIPMEYGVIQMVSQQLIQWQSDFCFPFYVSVNLSGKQFSHPDLVSKIQTILIKTGLYPSSLNLEITESLITEDNTSVISTLNTLRNLGLRFSVDDFGTGYSSLSRIHDYPIDTLKIDQSFIARLGPNGENSETIRTIITLAHSLGMDVVAEGIQTPEQLKTLISLHCSYGQGYLFSEPLPAAAAKLLLQKNSVS
jgi:diguanylate cyclase (GGDEF)-like protein/PAS domain S-box-containing protein